MMDEIMITAAWGFQKLNCKTTLKNVHFGENIIIIFHHPFEWEALNIYIYIAHGCHDLNLREKKW